MIVVMVVVGAAVGAPLRYVTDRSVQKRHDAVFPWGTFTVNVAACLVLGVVTGAAVAARRRTRCTPWPGPDSAAR